MTGTGPTLTCTACFQVLIVQHNKPDRLLCDMFQGSGGTSLLLAAHLGTPIPMESPTVPDTSLRAPDRVAVPDRGSLTHEGGEVPPVTGDMDHVPAITLGSVTSSGKQYSNLSNCILLYHGIRSCCCWCAGPFASGTFAV